MGFFFSSPTWKIWMPKKMSPNAIKGVLSTVPCATVQFLALLSSFLALLSSLYFSFWVSCKQGTFLYFRQTILIHLYHYTYLFFQICNFFPYFGPIHIFDFLRLLAISSRYCPFPRATVQFLALLSTFLVLLLSMPPLDKSEK